MHVVSNCALAFIGTCVNLRCVNLSFLMCPTHLVLWRHSVYTLEYVCIEVHAHYISRHMQAKCAIIMSFVGP